MEKKPLSAKQKQILDFLKSEIRSKGYPPSVREICVAVSLSSTSSVHAQLNTLENKGYIKRDPSKPRTIEILEDDFYSYREISTNVEMINQDTVSLPVVGRVAAGEPIFADQNIDDYFSLNAAYVPVGAKTFVLRVKGESMINVGIYDGDLLIVSEQSSAHNGEIVVALVDDSATVKTFYKEDGYYRLQPENDTMDPIIVEECQILGKVVGLYRQFNQ